MASWDFKHYFILTYVSMWRHFCHISIKDFLHLRTCGLYMHILLSYSTNTIYKLLSCIHICKVQYGLNAIRMKHPQKHSGQRRGYNFCDADIYPGLNVLRTPTTVSSTWRYSTSLSLRDFSILFVVYFRWWTQTDKGISCFQTVTQSLDDIFTNEPDIICRVVEKYGWYYRLVSLFCSTTNRLIRQVERKFEPQRHTQCTRTSALLL